MRDLLFAGISPSYVAKLPIVPSPSAQLLSDLSRMNDDEIIDIGVAPLESWLRNVAYWQAEYPDRQRAFRISADKVAQAKIESLEVSPLDGVVSDVTVPERLIFQNDLLRFPFLHEAQKVGASVARLSISLDSREKVLGHGTGWLLTRDCLITNHHVIKEALDHNGSRLRMNVSLTAGFDFDTPAATPVTVEVRDLVAKNPELDYAILRLSTFPPAGIMGQREPLKVNTKPLPSDFRMPVNIIQHPRGGPKQIALRNNLAASLTEMDLAYYSDTMGGSSGSPVCDDSWSVVALHKAATQTFGRLEFQGKATAWVNVGTRIDRIITDLKIKNPKLAAAVRSQS